jgi:hypothetical protein
MAELTCERNTGAIPSALGWHNRLEIAPPTNRDLPDLGGWPRIAPVRLGPCEMIECESFSATLDF